MTYSDFKPPSCAGCTLLQAPGPCWGSGSPNNAKIIYIAQNPGETEVKSTPMQPLVGASGRIFNRQLAEAGIRRDELFVTNQVKCLTPQNRVPTDHEIRCCKPLLQAELDRCKADTVILAGDVPLRANLNGFSCITKQYRPQGGIFSRMGCVERRDGRKWIGTLHPAFVMRAPQYRQVAIDHLKKAWIVAGIPLKEIKIEERPSDNAVLALVDHIVLHSREFSDDVETVGLEDVEEDDYIGGDFIVTMCGVGGRPYEALILEPSQIKLLAPIFADPTIQRYEHNGSYDQYHIEKYLGAENMPAYCYDTMQGAHFHKSFAPKKLKPYVLSQYTLLPYYQGAGSKKDNLGKINMRVYNGMDVITTFLAAKELKRQHENWGTTDVVAQFALPILPIAEEMRRVGVNVDLRRALLFKRVLEQRIEKAATILGKIGGPLFAYTNHFHIKDLLYTRMKLPPQYKEDKHGKTLTSDFEARKRLRKWIEAGRRDEYKLAFDTLQLLDFIGGETKKLEYIGRISGDGRIHPYFKGHGTRPFRLSSSPNLQNFPVYDINDWGGARRDDFEDVDNPIGEEHDKGAGGLGSLRSMVIPDDPENDWIITCDYEQLQLWIMAAVFDVKWLKSIFESREYIYGIVYETLYKEPYFTPGKPKTKENKLDSIPEQRIRRAKAVPLGFLFGRQAKAVATEYGWDMAEANKLRNWWFDLCPELLKGYSQIEYKLKQQGWIRHKFGQIIHYPEGKLTEAINNHAQSNESFVLRGSLIEASKALVQRGLRAQGCRLMLTVHDSISFNSPQKYVEEVVEEIIKPVLERPIPQLGGFKFRHSVEVSKRWDWDVIKYPKWKALHGNRAGAEALVGGASLHPDQHTRRESV